METPLTPLEFARRARKLYPDRVAVIDGDSRWTYAQFLDRCDRWSTALQKLGINPGDRGVHPPNTHAQLDRSMPCRKSALSLPLNYRLTADDFVYLINHSGSRMVCADRDYLATIDSIRGQVPEIDYFVALREGSRWLARMKQCSIRARLNSRARKFTRPICLRSITPAGPLHVRKA